MVTPGNAVLGQTIRVASNTGAPGEHEQREACDGEGGRTGKGAGLHTKVDMDKLGIIR